VSETLEPQTITRGESFSIRRELADYPAGAWSPE